MNSSLVSSLWSKFKVFADDEIYVTEKLKFCFEKGRKHHGKRRKCWLPAFSPFSMMFSKDSFIRVVKSWDCVVKSSAKSIDQDLTAQCVSPNLGSTQCASLSDNGLHKSGLSLFSQCFLILSLYVKIGKTRNSVVDYWVTKYGSNDIYVGPQYSLCSVIDHG